MKGHNAIDQGWATPVLEGPVGVTHAYQTQLLNQIAF